MKPIARMILLTTFALSGAEFLAAQGGTAAADEAYPVRIIIEPRPDAKFYQIEWLENNDIEEQADATAGKSERQKILKSEIRRTLPARFKYFRLRSAYRDNLFGPWGQIVEIQRPQKATNNTGKPTANTNGANKPVNNGVKPGPGAKPVNPQDVFAQVIDKNGKVKWVLRGTSVPADRLDQNTPLFYDVECLTEKNAPENTNGRRKYEGPIPFVRAGQYKMNLFATEDPARTEPLQTWIFWVYTEIPRSYVKFYAPFLHGRGGFTVGGKTKIAFRTHPSPVAVDKIEYRIYAEGKKPGAWTKYEDEIEVNSFAKDQYGFYTVEYQTTNVAGATEPPQNRRLLIDAKGPTIEEIPAGPDGGEPQLTFKDENFPIVIRVYQGDTMVEDKYFQFWRAKDTMKLPAPGLEIRAIDLLGNETILKK